MDDRFEVLQRSLERLEERNRRVQADKAWETSIFRRVIIALLTYAVAFIVLFSVGSVRPFFDACIPVIGYVLSTQSLPFIKVWWLKRRE